MPWIRRAALALALLPLLGSTAFADSSIAPPQTSVRVSPGTVASDDERPPAAATRPSFKIPFVTDESKVRATPLTTALDRILRLAGPWRVNVGISPGSQDLGVANGHIVEDRWVNFHFSLGLRLR